jgi:hypothetical protein
MLRRFVMAALIVAAFGLARSPAYAQQGWYFKISPPHGPAFDVGPYQTQSACADMLGSALYAHPWGCHLGGKDCSIIGNGFAYPASYPYPVPADKQIPGSACFEADAQHLPDGGTALPRGWYFLYYSARKGSVEKCSDYPKFKKRAKTTPGDQIANYSEMRCFGAPCFSVGFSTACE